MPTVRFLAGSSRYRFVVRTATAPSWVDAVSGVCRPIRWSAPGRKSARSVRGAVTCGE